MQSRILRKIPFLLIMLLIFTMALTRDVMSLGEGLVILVATATMILIIAVPTSDREKR